MLAARRLAILVGAVGLFTLQTAGGAASPPDGVAELRRQATSLAERERAATIDLYALESQLASARERLSALAVARGSAEERLQRLHFQLEAAWQSAFVAERRLGERLRQLYQREDVDPLAVLLGAESLDDAISGLEGLRSLASGDRAIVRQVREARATLRRAKARVAARVAALRDAERAAAQTAAALDGALASRRAFVASLAAQRGFTTRRIARVQRTARAATARATPEAAPVSVPVETPATGGPEPLTGERTLTVTATGYSIVGRTATGLPTAWGIVAVDPSVIPLGTRLTIPGYGEGVAADTGGAVRGAKIDLWFPTRAEALAWGRRTVTITVHG